MEHRLQRAIRRDRLRVVYQPIVQLGSGRIVGAEALARWTDEDGMAVGPDVFVKAAEERGFIGELTELVVRHVLEDLGELLRGRPDFHVSVNVTAADLSDPKFLPMLDQELKQAAVPARSLAIEITEASTAKQEVAMAAIRQLRRRGHSVHIDDFGTGYSSLSYLHSLSIDTIKIDRSFTQAVGTQALVFGILPQILAMAEALNLGVVVEGIETPEQAEYFTAARQRVLAQGWLFGHPVPASEFCGLLSTDAKQEPVTAIEGEPFDERLLRTA
jgi:sensor c-di-GMP phosphodiesterase-like protein